MLYCLRASASAISQARSVASAICKLVDIGHQFIYGTRAVSYEGRPVPHLVTAT